MASPTSDRRSALVLATSNAGKLAELRALLADLPIDLETPASLGMAFEVVEDGVTFAENALLKARAAARATGLRSLADDSGLEVDALGGRPGVRSARFAGERATDEENNAALLAALAGLDAPGAFEGRVAGFPARFRCVLALADPRTPAAALVEGVCEGAVIRVARGTGGFGYDPLFAVDPTGRTLAELDPEAKNALSHRGRALRALRAVLERTVLDGPLQSR